MPVTLNQSTVTVFKPQGHLNATNADAFRSQLIAVLSSPQDSILLVDLEQVQSVDSSGLMVFISALKQSRNLGRRFSLCSVPSAVKIVFELTQMDRVFEIFDDYAAFQAEVGSIELNLRNF